MIRKFKKSYSDFHYHITSGDTEQVTEKLDKGILDFAVLVEAPDASKYESLRMPEANIWGLVIPAGSPLAAKDRIRFDDFQGLPLFASEQSIHADIPRWSLCWKILCISYGKVSCLYADCREISGYAQRIL